jgi:hypothetical protein
MGQPPSYWLTLSGSDQALLLAAAEAEEAGRG